MNIRPIRTEDDYEAALDRIEQLFDASPGTPEVDELEILAILVEAYEEQHHPIPAPDPVAIIEYHMESRGLSRRDLEPYIGSRARVSEILNRKRPLTLRMIRQLHQGLDIAPELLIQPYPIGQRQERNLEYDSRYLSRSSVPVQSVPENSGTKYDIPSE